MDAKEINDALDIVRDESRSNDLRIQAAKRIERMVGKLDHSVVDKILDATNESAQTAITTEAVRKVVSTLHSTAKFVSAIHEGGS